MPHKRRHNWCKHAIRAAKSVEARMLKAARLLHKPQVALMLRAQVDDGAV